MRDPVAYITSYIDILVILITGSTKLIISLLIHGGKVLKSVKVAVRLSFICYDL